MDSLLCSEILLAPQNNKSDAVLFVEGSYWHNSLFSNNAKNLKSILAKINIKLSDPKTRLEALLLLNCVLCQASFQVFSENCQHWVQHLKKIILHDVDLNVRHLAAKIFGEILHSASKWPEQNRYMAVTLAPQLIVQLLDLDERYDVVVAHSLVSMLKFLPGPCRQHLAAIQKRLFEMLTMKNLEVVDVSSTCVSLLPFVSGGDRGNTHSTSWLDLYKRFCHSLHWELNTLYENMEVDQQVTSDLGQQVIFPLTLERADSASLFLDVYQRSVAICTCLRKMLSNGSNALLTVPVEASLTLIRRILKVTGKAVASRSSLDPHAVLLFTFLPSLHGEALAILEHLIQSCRRHLLLHDQKILSLLLQILQWTSAIQQSQSENKQALSKLRGVAYRVLVTWLNIAGSSTDLSHFGDAITRQMLKDIIYEEKATKLSMDITAKLNNNSSRSKKRKLEEPLLQTQNTPSILVDKETCYMAIKALQSVTYTTVEDLRITTFEVICSKVVSILLKLQLSLADPSAVPPYDDIKCRAALYKLLLAIVVTPWATSHALLSKCIYIFSHGQMDTSAKIVQVCSQGLTTCRLIIEPIRRSLPGIMPPCAMDVDIQDADDHLETPLLGIQCDCKEATDQRVDRQQKIFDANLCSGVPTTKEINLTKSLMLESNPSRTLEIGMNEPSPFLHIVTSEEEETDPLTQSKESPTGSIISIPEVTLPVVSPVNVFRNNCSPKLPSVEPESPKCVCEIVETCQTINGDMNSADSDVEITEPSSADVILRTFVDSFPDDQCTQLD